MATNKWFFLDPNGLAQYDGLIKQYINTEDAKAIKYLTFEPAAGAGALPTTIRFWKVDPSASGAVAAYTVTLPDATTLMTKISGGTTGNLVKLDANGQVVDVMDSIGKKELKILKSFEYFSNIIERIQGKPEFDSFHKDDICIPLYEQENLKKDIDYVNAL